MSKANRKTVGLFIAMMLLLTLILPQAAFAYTVLGDMENPKLTIHKYEQEPGTPQGEAGNGLPGQPAEGAPVEGVEFTLTQTHSFNPATNEWTEVTGATPIVGVTNTAGQIEFTKADNLGLGRYEVQETNGPDHVILNTTVFTVDVPMTNKDRTTLNYDVHIYPKNEIVRGDAELIKKGEDGSILPGVVFGLFNDQGEQLEELTTDAEGKIKIENLPAGSYYFQEIRTVDGYTLNDTKIHFVVTQNAGGSVVEWTNSNINEGNEVTNYKMPEIEKDVEGTTHFEVDRDTAYTYNLAITTPGDIANYQAIGVRDVLDDRLTYVADSWTVTGTPAANIKFVQNGQTLTWEVIDLTQLTANQEIKISFKAKIKPDAVLLPEENGIPNDASLHFDNDHGSFTEPTDPTTPPDPTNPPPVDPPTTPPVTVDPTEGGLKIIKVDKADHTILLQGAEFKLTTDEQGENIVDATGTIITVNGQPYTGLLENLATDVNGEILIDGLTPGTYYLHETKAPTYTDENGEEKPYRLLTSPVEVTVVDGVAAENEVTVENSKSGWELPVTGGIGTTLFTLVGAALMGIAAMAFLRRRKVA